jgi:hypothetical protein
LQSTAHRARDIVLVVEPVGRESHGATRDDLANEYHAAAHFLADRAAHIVAQVDFGEARVPGDGNAEQSDSVEAEADNADVGLAVVQVGFGAGRDERFDGGDGNREIEQEKLGPAGGEDGAWGHVGFALSRKRQDSGGAAIS